MTRTSAYLKTPIVILLMCLGSIAYGLPALAQAAPSLRGQTDLTKVYRDLPYVPGSRDSAQTLDLYIPKQSAANNSPMPVVVFIHGGGWRAGSKERGPFPLLLQAGFAVASIDYRLSQAAIFPAQIYDVKAAVRWLRAHCSQYNLDPKRFGAWGPSAGGHLVALLGTSGGVAAMEGNEGNNDQSSRVQAVCDFFGPTDFTAIDSQGGEHTAVPALLGSSPAKNPQAAKSASPVTYVSSDCPPFFIAHGDHDAVVPLAQSQELYDALRRAGVEAQLEVVPNGEHGLPKASPRLFPMAISFLKKHLSPASDTASRQEK